MKEGWFHRFLARIVGSADAPPPEIMEKLKNFTPRAQQTLALARMEADRFQHYFVGTEHLLLGLIRLGQGTAATGLVGMGVDLDTARREVEKLVGVGPGLRDMGNIPYTPGVKKVLAMAAGEAIALHHTYIGTEHILLGLLGESEGVAARVMKNLGVDLEQTRLTILRELDPESKKNRMASKAWKHPKSEVWP